MLFLSPLGCLPSTSKATLGSTSVRACCAASTTRHQGRRRVLSATRSLPRTCAASPSTSLRPFTSSAIRSSAISSTSSAVPVTLPPSLRARIETYLQGQKGKAPETSLPNDQQSFSARILALRKHSKVTFLSVTDGSISSSTLLQVVLTAEAHESVDRGLKKQGRPPLGVADTVELTGSFAVRSRLQGAVTASTGIEFKAERCQVLGSSDRETSPLVQKPGNDAASVSASNAQRQQPHLRSLLPAPAATMRFRSRLELAMASFFAQHDFVRTTPPIMTASDCEGAGEVFRVVDESHEAAAAAAGESGKQESNPAYLTVSSQLHLEALMLGLSRVYTFTPAFRAEDSDTNRHLREFWMCEAELVTRGETASEELEMLMTFVEDLIKAAAKTAFGEAFSTVEAAQSQGADLTPSSIESDVSPTATATLDALYLWGLEPERRRSPKDKDKDEARSAQQEKRSAQLSSFSTLASNLSPTTRWPRITYTDALKLLESKHSSHQPFVRPPPVWGEGLGSEHEKWLAEEHVCGPLFVVDYPASSKPFYMRLAREEPAEGEPEQGREIVKNFDLLVPSIGELVGGSLREDSPTTLLSRLKSLHLLPSTAEEVPSGHPLYWYVEELRKNGMAPHGGFGMGVERLLAWMAGRGSVRESIPFPRVGRRVRF